MIAIFSVCARAVYFLIIRNYELELFLPVHELRNCELENHSSDNSFLIRIPVPIPDKFRQLFEKNLM